MTTVNELRRRRAACNKREAIIEKALKEARNDREHLFAEERGERNERARLRERRQEIHEQIDKEFLLDAEGQGEHNEEWEKRRQNRLDEIADLYEASENRSDRLARAILEEKHDIKELLKKDKEWERRIERINLRIKRIQRREGQLTKDFYIAEFDCRNGTPVPGYMEPHLEALCRKHLQPLRNSGGTVSINSGYRTAAYNASIGGASQSYHVYDIRKKSPAADHIQVGRSAPAVQAWHEAHNPFDGMGFYAGFTHGDDRGYHSRWWGAS